MKSTNLSSNLTRPTTAGVGIRARMTEKARTALPLPSHQTTTNKRKTEHHSAVVAEHMIGRMLKIMALLAVAAVGSLRPARFWMQRRINSLSGKPGGIIISIIIASGFSPHVCSRLWGFGMVAVVLTCLLAAVAVMLVVHCEGLLGSSQFYCIWHHHRALLVVVVILVELIFVVFMPVELLSRSRSSSSKQEQRQQQQQRSGGQCDATPKRAPNSKLEARGPETESLVIEASCGCLACSVRVVTKTTKPSNLRPDGILPPGSSAQGCRPQRP